MKNGTCEKCGKSKNAKGRICTACRFSHVSVTDHTVLVHNMNRVLDNLILEFGLSVPTGDWDKNYYDRQA